MERFGIIVTEKVTREDLPIHWLKRGTLVKFLPDECVESVAPCEGVPMAKFSKRKHMQHVGLEDVVEIDALQLVALIALTAI